jgi:hypothetical protein
MLFITTAVGTLYRKNNIVWEGDDKYWFAADVNLYFAGE